MTTPEGRPALRPAVQAAVCAVAALGFLFDIYELLMLPLIVRPALADLGGIAPGTPEFSHWVGLLFFIPALCGGGGGCSGPGGGFCGGRGSGPVASPPPPEQAASASPSAPIRARDTRRGSRVWRVIGSSSERVTVAIARR